MKSYPDPVDDMALEMLVESDDPQLVAAGRLIGRLQFALDSEAARYDQLHSMYASHTERLNARIERLEEFSTPKQLALVAPEPESGTAGQVPKRAFVRVPGARALAGWSRRVRWPSSRSMVAATIGYLVGMAVSAVLL